MTTEEILALVKEERDYQIMKWGNDADDALNDPYSWLTWINMTGTKWACGQHQFTTEMTDDFRQRMIQVAALAVAAVESIDRQREENGKTFYEH
jgi:hypothetical protein